MKHFDGVLYETGMYEKQRKPHSVVSDRWYDTKWDIQREKDGSR